MIIMGVLVLSRLVKTRTVTRRSFITPLGSLIMGSGMIVSVRFHIFVGLVLILAGGAFFLVGAIPQTYHNIQAYKRLVKKWEN